MAKAVLNHFLCFSEVKMSEAPKSGAPGIFPYRGALGAKRLKTTLSSRNTLYCNVFFLSFPQVNYEIKRELKKK